MVREYINWEGNLVINQRITNIETDADDYEDAFCISLVGKLLRMPDGDETWTVVSFVDLVGHFQVQLRMF